MRFRSSFHDYYDAALSEGHDTSIQYLRFPKVVELDQFPFSKHGILTNKLWVRTNVIGFCDKTHYVLEVNTSDSSDWLKQDRNRRRYCYSVEDIDSFVRANFKPKEFEAYLEGSKGWSQYESRKYFMKFFETKKLERKEYFKDHPIFVATAGSYGDKSKLVYNACLKPFEFFRIYDPYTAFQELSMWLGNKAVPMKPIPEMSDAIKIGSHGYNEWSFRKEPTKKK